MQRVRTAIVALFASTCTIWVARADLPQNPYSSVIVRNAFGLKPPPPPAAETPVQAAIPLPKVVLTGIITSLFGPTPRVLLEVTEQEPGKTVNVKRPIMQLGEKDGLIEILEVDIARNYVRIRNGTVETNLTFEVAKAAPSPAAPTALVSGAPHPLSAGSTPSAGSAVGSPTIISPSGANAAGRSGTGVAVYGGNNSVASSGAGAPTSYAGNPSPYGSAPNNPSLVSAAAGISTYGGGDVPSRPLRSDPTVVSAPDQANRILTQKQAANQAGMPFPPLPPSPHFQGASGAPTVPTHP